MGIETLISKELNIDINYIYKIANYNDKYRRYKVKERVVYHPSRELKVLQYWVCNNIFSKFPISEFSMAYNKGNSIKRNALHHKNSRYILHTDIEKFFENINGAHIEQLFFNNKDIIDLNNNDIDLIKKIVLYNGKMLVTGSVSAPLISNCIMYSFDEKMYEIIKKMNYKYTRYSDDIIISSSNYIDDEILKYVSKLLSEFGFNINRTKTYFMNKSSNRRITGITIDNNNNSLSLGCKKYKEIKKMIYEYLVKGLGDVDEIQGYLSFIKDINLSKYESLKAIYIKYEKNRYLFPKSK